LRRRLLSRNQLGRRVTFVIHGCGLFVAWTGRFGRIVALRFVRRGFSYRTLAVAIVFPFARTLAFA
jgi:voltage-gated potassium channel Kch